MVAVKEIPSAELDAATYMDVVKPFAGTRGNVPIRIVWALLFTPMETIGAMREKAGSPVMPAWMESCWQGLPLSMLPEVTFDGLDWLSQQLRDRFPEASAGNGLIIEALGKAIFVGFGEEAGFYRISRPAYVREDRGRGLDEDWCQQTRMLYRNRTGLELKRILILESNIPEAPIPGDCGLETVPINWARDRADLEAFNCQESVRCLHSCLLNASLTNPASGLADPCLKYRKSQQMASALRAGISLMACGWLLLLLGACQSFNNRASQDPELLNRWNDEKAIWEESNKKYQKHLTDLSKGHAPFRIVAVVARGIPQNLEVDRIHIREREDTLESVHALTLEGCITDGNPDDEFRQWIESLQQDFGADREELKLLPEESGLRFHYLCGVPIGGIDQ